jgi:hypothetical protein
LKYGGRHIFTVPFYQNDFFDEERSVLKDDGQVLHLKPPEYHDDPIRPEGALVYRIFSLEMLCLLRKIGFTTKFYKLYEPIFGILGNNALVFEAVKT